MEKLTEDIITLLKKLIKTQSFSREEEGTAEVITSFFQDHDISVERHLNNIWVRNQFFDEAKPTILLNSHHDTVKPNKGYTKDPFKCEIADGKLFGLGSNDAGGPLVALIGTFVHFYHRKNLHYNFIIAATAEEEISGKNGIECLIPELPKIDFAIVGEPTLMQMAVAEKGLLVIDCYAKGISGHAARNEGVNAIYEAMEDIDWFKNYGFPNVSPSLGKVHMNVTQIEAGSQHNVVPAECKFTVDIRVTDVYTHEEILAIIDQNTQCEVIPRSTRLKSSGIPMSHPVVKSGLAIGMEAYGSPTLSDQALMPFTSIKIGPGDSARSHTADEFIFIEEIENGLKTYIKLLEGIV